jgi:hypothetical protein
MEIKELLGLGALVLSIINGLALLRYYLRDRPKLTVEPLHPDVYQWWFKLPGREHEGNPTRKYGFLAYISIANRGLRKVSLDSWHLLINTEVGKQTELTPVSIPEPKWEFAGGTKLWQVLGQKGLSYEGNTVVDSGCSISGMAYYFVEFYGTEGWNPKTESGKIVGELVIKDVFGKKAHSKIVFSETPLERIESMIEGITKIA